MGRLPLGALLLVHMDPRGAVLGKMSIPTGLDIPSNPFRQVAGKHRNPQVLSVGLILLAQAGNLDVSFHMQAMGHVCNSRH